MNISNAIIKILKIVSNRILLDLYQNNYYCNEELRGTDIINTESYKKSAIPSMLRLLNEEEMRMNEALNISVPRESCFYNSISVKI